MIAPTVQQSRVQAARRGSFDLRVSAGAVNISISAGQTLRRRRSLVFHEVPAQASVSSMGRTRDRLEHLVVSASEWSAEMEIDPPTAMAVERARAILALIPRDIADRQVRIFPSEQGGIAMQVMGSGIRLLEIEDAGVLATWVDRDDNASEYNLQRDSDAVAFLLAG